MKKLSRLKRYRQLSVASPQVSPNTKAAEKKLKEMSRKAKERGKPQNASARGTRTRSEPVIKLNQNLLLGGLGVSVIIAIGYFIYKSRGSLRTSSELQPFYHPPREEEEKKGPEAKPGNAFDLHSF